MSRTVSSKSFLSQAKHSCQLLSLLQSSSAEHSRVTKYMQCIPWAEKTAFVDTHVALCLKGNQGKIKNKNKKNRKTSCKYINPRLNTQEVTR